MSKLSDLVSKNSRDIKVTRNPDGSRTTEVDSNDIKEIGKIILDLVRIFVRK